MNSHWQHTVTKSVKSLYWWPPLPKGLLRGTEFIHWVTQTQLGQGNSMKCKGRLMLQWEYQSCTHWHGIVPKPGQGGWGFSHIQGGRREKPTRSARVLSDVKIAISSMGWACWAAADLLRKARPRPWWWGRNPQQKEGGSPTSLRRVWADCSHYLCLWVAVETTHSFSRALRGHSLFPPTTPHKTISTVN